MSEIYTDPPQSRNEAIIRATIDGTQYTAPPQSRMEDLLLELKEAIEQGGGGGTSDYSQLSNKPSINDVTLSGNKTSADLGLMPTQEVDTTPTEDSENLITSGGVYEADEEIKDELQGSKTATGNPITITDTEPMNAESVLVELEPKQDLHGYDKPWAGGAGKNKIDVENITMQSAGLFINKVLNLSANTYTLSFDCTVSENAQVQLDLKSGETIVATKTISINAGTSRASVSLTTSADTNVITAYISTSATIEDVQLELGQTATDFEPYSNICPISGYSEVNVECNSDTYTISLDGTKYGGVLDVTEGGYSDEWGYYTIDGDTVGVVEGGNGFYVCHGPNDMIPPSSQSEVGNFMCDSEIVLSANAVIWENQYGICDTVDEYLNNYLYIRLPFGGTVAEFNTWLQSNPISIAYHKTPSSVSTTPTDIPLLENTNNISTDGTNIQLKYQPNNVIGECKAYTDEQVQKVLPQPPTTDGTYRLECSVSGGIPTIRWVSNS